MNDFVFVLEQTLGHAAHARNLERVVAAEPDVAATFIPLEYSEPSTWRRLPGLRNWSLRASWAARRQLNRKLAASSPHAIYIHTQVASLLATGIMRRVPTVISMDATPIGFDRIGRAYAHRTAHPAVEAAKRRLNQRAFAAAAALVTWSRWAAGSLSADYGIAEDKVRVIPPGVDHDLFRPVVRERRAPVRLLFVGGDFERKGGLDLMSSVAPLGDQVELDIVTGSDVPQAAGGVAVRVHRGVRPQSRELIGLFERADIFVLPTRGECHGQAIVEAMASGLAVVASPVGGVPELVRHRETGLIVPPGEPHSLAQALAALVDNPARREAMGRAGSELARREHDMAVNNRRILSLMSELAMGSARDMVLA